MNHKRIFAIELFHHLLFTLTELFLITIIFFLYREFFITFCGICVCNFAHLYTPALFISLLFPPLPSIVYCVLEKRSHSRINWIDLYGTHCAYKKSYRHNEWTSKVTYCLFYSHICEYFSQPYLNSYVINVIHS
jgi:hypothetical protein